MEFLVIPVVAAGASLLTFFSGFGLGTILTPVFVIFFDVELAVALTAIVHLSNNLFKFILVGKFTDIKIFFRFGLPALVSAFVGAWILTHISHFPPVATYNLWGRDHQILWIKLVMAVLMLSFTIFETIPRFKNVEFDPKFLPLGGMLSGFFGGLSGHQGALRSAFLARAGLTKESFIATGVSIACLVDIVRLSVYSQPLYSNDVVSHWPLLVLTTFAAFLGAYLGRHFLKKITKDGVQIVVATLLIVLSVALASGLI